MRERRRFRRFKVRLDAGYLKVQGPISISSLSKTENISLGGLCVRLSRLIKKGDELIIEVIYSADKTFATLARVRWIKLTEEGYANICGLQFLWVSPSSFLNDCIDYAGGVSEI